MAGGGGGCKVIVPVADRELSTTLVAVTVTVCRAAILAGAVYNPEADTAPVPGGLRLQVSPVLLVPVTRGLNCWVWDANRLAPAGVIETATGWRLTVALADLEGSATLVAVTETV